MLLAKGKTEYRFIVQDAQDAERKIQSWLSANSFQQMREGNIIYYRGGDAMIMGYRFFEYNISGSQVVIYAYLGSFQKPCALADDMRGAMAIIPYKNALAPLLEALGSSKTQFEQYSTAGHDQAQIQSQNTYTEFQQATNKRNNTCAEISFWVSILMLLASFMGVSLSTIIVIFNYYLAAQGLKSDKKGKSIAAIVISSITIVIIVIGLIWLSK